MNAREFVGALGRERASAILRTEVAEAVGPAMEAAIKAGFRIVEFTLTTPNALEHIGEFSRREELIVGAGTVLTQDEACSAVKAGASFLVSPVVDEAVIETAAGLDVASMPGCHTPSEMLRARRAGAPLQKLFPAPAGGPDYVRACLAPMPFLRIVPTNGVDGDNVRDYLEAGAFAVGFVGPLFDPADVAAGRFDAIERRGRELLRRITRK